MKFRILLLTFCCSVLASCNNWLDITAEDIVTEDQQFSEASGFHTSLNGIYKKLAVGSLYGRELSYGFVDVLSQAYNRDGYGSKISQYHYYYQTMDFNYTGNQEVKSAIAGIWENAYSAIANTNNLLDKIDDANESLFKYGEYEKNLIKGEALAIRAMMHFDILRLFAPAPSAGSTEGYIPYVTVFPYRGGQAAETVSDILGKVENDLLEAQRLIMAYDTLDSDKKDLLTIHYRFTKAQSQSNKDLFYYYRGYRMNAIAVTAILARVYNYAGKHDLAAAEAKKVVEFKDSGERTILSYTNGDNMRYDRKCADDLIFCLSDPYLFDNYNTYDIASSNSCLRLRGDILLFPDQGDYRLLNLLDYDDWDNIYQSFKNVRQAGDHAYITRGEDMLPMIRLSEMHLILAEAEANNERWQTANDYLNQLRAGRNTVIKNFDFQNMNDFKEVLFEEIRREFFNEGQVFFYYKKYSELLTSRMTHEDFCLPIPDSEKIH